MWESGVFARIASRKSNIRGKETPKLRYGTEQIPSRALSGFTKYCVINKIRSFGSISIEIKVNKEVRDFQESVFFGLTLRQCLFALAAILAAVAVYFGLRNVIAEAG